MAFQPQHQLYNNLQPKPILLIDMDGVIADYYQQFLNVWTTLYPDRKVYAPEDLTDFYMERVYDKKYENDIFKITRGKNFFKSMPTVIGAVDALSSIIKDTSFEVFLCSTPDSHTEDHCCASEKTNWINDNLGEEWSKKLILTHDKTLIHGDYLIDDKPVITGIGHRHWEHIFFTQSYNKHLSGSRLNNWDSWPSLREEILQDYHR